MLGVIVTILRILGWILLAVLLALVGAILLVLLVPIRYEVDFQRPVPEVPFRAALRLRWMVRLLRLEVTANGTCISGNLRLAWRTLKRWGETEPGTVDLGKTTEPEAECRGNRIESKGWPVTEASESGAERAKAAGEEAKEREAEAIPGKETKEREIESASEKEIKENQTEAVSEKETKDGETDAVSEKEIEKREAEAVSKTETKECEVGAVSENETKDCEPETVSKKKIEECEAEKDSEEQPDRRDKAAFYEKWADKLAGLPDWILKWLDKLLELPGMLGDRVEQFEQKLEAVSGRLEKLKKKKDLWLSEPAKKVYARAWKRLKKVLRSYRIRRVRGHLRYGTGSPDQTGMLTGALYMVLPAGAGTLELEPELYEAVLEGTVQATGHIRLNHLVTLLIAVVFNRDSWNWFKLYRAGKRPKAGQARRKKPGMKRRK